MEHNAPRPNNPIPIRPPTSTGNITSREDLFFGFFLKKRVKVAIAFIAALVGMISNYMAMRHQMSLIRIDFLRSGFIYEVYAIGITLFLDVAIVFFYLMRINFLVWVSSVTVVLLSLYANLNVLSQNRSIFDLLLRGFGDFSYAALLLATIAIALLPATIFSTTIKLTIKQYEEEKALKKGEQKK
jgi:hypothetical protein